MSFCVLQLLLIHYVTNVYCAVEQFNCAQLSIFNNSWANVSDLSPGKDEPNFEVITEVSHQHLSTVAHASHLCTGACNNESVANYGLRK